MNRTPTFEFTDCHGPREGPVTIPPQREQVGKILLATALGWTRPRLDRRIESDPNFPIHRRGDQRGGWVFILADVVDYLRTTAGPEPPAASTEEAAIAPTRKRAFDKNRLAGALGWTRPRLDRRLRHDPDFPILARGDRRGGWEFDLAAVSAHLTAKPVLPPARAPRRTDNIRALAAALGWTRRRLDREIASDPNFPVQARHKGRAWRFDVMRVRAYLDAKPEPPGPKG